MTRIFGRRCMPRRRWLPSRSAAFPKRIVEAGVDFAGVLLQIVERSLRRDVFRASTKDFQTGAHHRRFEALAQASRCEVALWPRVDDSVASRHKPVDVLRDLTNITAEVRAVRGEDG